jgi:hypothetical protein
MKNFIRISVLAMAGAMLGLPTTVLAQDTAAKSADKPCAADAARLCPGVEPGGGKQIACLKAHKADLSAACKKKIVEKKEQQELKKEQENQAPSEQNPSNPNP